MEQKFPYQKLGYNALVISTIVDKTYPKLILKGYNALVISTIVDDTISSKTVNRVC